MGKSVVLGQTLITDISTFGEMLSYVALAMEKWGNHPKTIAFKDK